MNLVRGYKTELAPDERQLPLLYQHAGVARFAYNWGLRWKLNVMDCNQLPHEHLRLPTAINLHKELNRLKKTKYAWMYESSKCAPQEALRDLDAAFSNFFEHRAGFPKFKGKKRGIGSFTLTGRIRARSDEIHLPRIGNVRLKERGYLPPRAHINSATISERAGRWFVAINVVEEIDEPKQIVGPAVGVDMGISELLVVSDGTTIENPRALSRHQKKLKHLQREISRKKKGSKNRWKAIQALRRKHYHVACVRFDAISKATTMLARTKSVIVVENLNVRGMMKNHSIAGSIADAGWAEAVRQLEYKTAWHGSGLLVADTWYPSTKRCSSCGNVKERIALCERIYHCEVCGLTIDRDLNAAKNLEQWPGVARTLKTPVEGGVQLQMVAQPPCESGTISLKGPGAWAS